jgi:hypothetical protein
MEAPQKKEKKGKKWSNAYTEGGPRANRICPFF